MITTATLLMEFDSSKLDLTTDKILNYQDYLHTEIFPIS